MAARVLATLPRRRTRSHLLVGPEGGWTPEELRPLPRAGSRPYRWAGARLRADAAPLVAMAALYEAWNAW